MSQHQPSDIRTLIDQVLTDDADGRDALARYAMEKLHPYIYRITLQEDLTQDIVQETVLEMFKVLGKLQDKDKFWPWLRGIAYNKLRHYFRREKRQRDLAVTAARNGADHPDQEGLKQLISHELEHIVMGAMRKLRSNYRAVLSMRCYEQMDYAQIAEIMGSSEFATRMTFVRAKRALARELSRNGLKKGMLLSALVVFGKLTAGTPAQAAQIQIPPTLLSAGAGATAAGWVSAKTVTATLAAAVVTTGALLYPAGPIVSGRPAGPATAGNHTAFATGGFAADDRIGEIWYYYPRETTGAVMTRILTAGHGAGQTLWLQNDRFNYRYDPGAQTVTLVNHHYWNPQLLTARLPGDPIDLLNALNQAEGRAGPVYRGHPGGRHLLFRVSQKETPGAPLVRISRQPKALEEEYYQYNWPDEVRMIDERDAAHKQGWAFFTIQGHLDGQPVLGRGQLPLVYAQRDRIRPQLELTVGHTIRCIESPQQSIMTLTGKGLSYRWEGGYFFRLTGRPWLGLHTLDVIRRDAAALGLTFETRLGTQKNKAQILITDNNNTGRAFVCTVDLEKDWLERIELHQDGTERAALNYQYGLAGQPPVLQAPGHPGPITTAAVSGPWLSTLLETVRPR